MKRNMIHSVCWNDLENLSRKGELLTGLKFFGKFFTLNDLGDMLVEYSKKLVYVRKEFATSLLDSARIQIVEGYHHMMMEELSSIYANARLHKSWREFVRFASIQTRGKRLAELKYLIAAYTIYIVGRPVHPVGTPFPGGYTVELHEGVYYCPVRDIQGEVDKALCRFCPAVQSRELDLLLTQKQREFVEREERLGDYFHNYHG